MSKQKQKPIPLTLKSLKADLDVLEAQTDLNYKEWLDLEERVHAIEHPKTPEPFYAPIPEDAAELDPIPAQVQFLSVEGKFAWIEFGMGIVVGAVFALIACLAWR